jgi:hypothetical protein
MAMIAPTRQSIGLSFLVGFADFDRAVVESGAIGDNVEKL